MPFFHKFFKTGKRPAFFLGLSLFIFTCLFSFFIFYTYPSRSFHKFTKELFCSELSQNSLSMHYTVANPGNFGLADAEAVLPVFSPKRQETQKEQLSLSLEFLHSINSSRLSKEDAYTYQLLLRYLENEYAAGDLLYYSEALSPSSGMQTQLPILLAEYAFRSKKDVEDYLDLLDETEDYFAGLLVFEQEKAKAGLFMSDASLKKVIAQCDYILEEKLLEEGSHFLQTTFTERLQSLAAQNLITETEILEYEAENNRLLKTVVKPAYTALGDGLLLLSGNGQNRAGLASFEHGKEYYAYLLRRDVGSYRDINDIKALLCQDFDENLDHLVDASTQNPTLLAHASDGRFDSLLPFEEPEEILSYLQKRAEQDFPALPSAVSCSVKSISKSLAAYCSPAFYLTPPLDDSQNNVIYINPDNNYNLLELFTTLAHEGYPGHLFQSVYYNSSSSMKQNPIRGILGYPGYAEGYALYVEFLSYDYACELALAAGKKEAANYYALLKTDRRMQLSLYALLDIAIHYDGADFDRIKTFLSSMGITEESSCLAIYEYIAEEPANYLKYYLGYLEIMELKESAKELWGEQYTDYGFHTFLLDAGPSDFKTLKERLLQKQP